MEFNLYGEEGYKRVENVPTFRYMGRTLYQTDDDCLAVKLNIMRARSVWGRLGTILRREGADPKVVLSFYRAAVQEILLYGSETWVLLASMAKSIEGTHTEFLQMIREKRAKQLGYGTWEKTGAEVLLEAAGIQSDRIYKYKRQKTMAQWVELHPLF